ncbi:SprT-like domain-containing protein [Frigoriflavimonas asaccharolytica]|uniref:SprT-like domain-containing protein n=1 Tax=Frigoriflavimonas asaccharolytica TaxID=2735899 RepID=A0A8J8K7L7_9FLAO|nr:SprT-like domain-containing protein [Frigoriflavimonas asaccharolytica]NRS91082.1 hypothetical protein [Frigoriflavimonas asaccharolytica]
MQLDILEKYLPENALPPIKTWFGKYVIHIKITRDRSSKLGDYQKVGDNKFIITINYNLQPELFFFVFTHEMAHLLAFERFGRRIAPHGKEWKDTFRKLLLETISIYSENVQHLILEYAINPKANFAASTGLKRHFYPDFLSENETFIENLQIGEVFHFREIQYKLQSKRRKNFLCSKILTGQEYIFRPLVKVEKVIQSEFSSIGESGNLQKSELAFVQDLVIGDKFSHDNINYKLEKKRRINYLCLSEQNGKSYIFPPLIKVKKIS